MRGQTIILLATFLCSFAQAKWHGRNANRYACPGTYVRPYVEPIIEMQAYNPSARLAVCGQRMCLYSYEGDPYPREVQILNDGTLAVWASGQYLELEERFRTYLAKRYAAALAFFQEPVLSLLRKVIRKYLPQKQTPQPIVLPLPISPIPPSPHRLPTPVSPPIPHPVRPPKPPSPIHSPNRPNNPPPFFGGIVNPPLPVRPNNSNTPPMQWEIPHYRFHQHNQGQAGTCHAFALLPIVDAFENTRLPFGGYKASSNWMVFLSVLDRLCDGTDTAVDTAGIYYPERTIHRLLNVGYCSDSDYNRYSAVDLIQNKKALAQSQRINPLSLDSLAEPRMAKTNGWRTALNIDAALDNLILYERDPAVSLEKGFIRNDYEDKFKQVFGISSHDAQRMCHINANTSATDILRGLNVSGPFSQCLTESMTNRNKFRRNGCGVRSFSQGDNRNLLQRAKQAIFKNQPVVILTSDYRKESKEHSNHAVTLTGYDDLAQQFTVMNSWGEGENYPVPYSKANDIRTITYLDCDRSGP
ncbi:MAG: hypothetical protein HYZ71_13965 [Deltaproteobacteria bacterium]|nr:hypothetical protein [Deltaproteobacteria bacterium]